MLETLLIYLGDSQREGRMITRRIRLTFILWIVCGVFFLLAFCAAIVGGAIYMAERLGAGPAALVVAAAAFLIGVIALIALAVLRRPRRLSRRSRTGASVAPVAMNSLISGAMQSRPLTTLVVAGALAFLALRPTVSKRRK
jgi:hypothetical protein